MTRECRSCKQEKDIEDFGKNKSKNGGILKICKECHNNYYKSYYSLKNNMNKHVKRVGQNKIKYREKIQTIKINKGCSICGYNKSARSLHFHHIDPKIKLFEIAYATRHSFRPAKIMEEIDKCILLCANCHGEIEDKIIASRQ